MDDLVLTSLDILLWEILIYVFFTIFSIDYTGSLYRNFGDIIFGITHSISMIHGVPLKTNWPKMTRIACLPCIPDDVETRNHFPHYRPFVVHPNKLLNKQASCRWFERHCACLVLDCISSTCQYVISYYCISEFEGFWLLFKLMSVWKLGIRCIYNILI